MARCGNVVKRWNENEKVEIIGLGVEVSDSVVKVEKVKLRLKRILWWKLAALR